MKPSSVASTSYRPFISLSCEMAQLLVSNKFFLSAPFVVGDVGARAGFDPFWSILDEQSVQIGFEPDVGEAERLKQLYDGNCFRIENVALWEHSGTIDFHVNRDPNTSSCYYPNLSFFNRLPDSSSIETLKTIQISTITLDQHSQTNKLDYDVLKIDVQGGELSILRGAINQLAS